MKKMKVEVKMKVKGWSDLCAVGMRLELPIGYRGLIDNIRNCKSNFFKKLLGRPLYNHK